jgi:Alginate lyase
VGVAADATSEAPHAQPSEVAVSPVAGDGGFVDAGRADVGPREVPADAQADARMDGPDSLDPSRPPGSNFDLSTWRLTIPVNSTGGSTGKAATIPSSALVAGYTSQFFFTNATGAMTFLSPANGATTSPGSGSDHTRSELRELATIPGRSGAEWTVENGGRLEATCTVQKTNTSGEATVGQIHGLSSIMVILALYPAKNVLRANVYRTPKNDVVDRYDLDTSASLNTPFSYSIEVRGNRMILQANGNAKTIAVDPSWNGAPVYFKAGAYSAAPNVGNANTDATQVAFTQLVVSH